jgi:hypothetical protein
MPAQSAQRISCQTLRPRVLEAPVLETPRLVLRGFTEADLPPLSMLAARRKIADTMIPMPHRFFGY